MKLTVCMVSVVLDYGYFAYESVSILSGLDYFIAFFIRDRIGTPDDTSCATMV